MTLSSNTYLQGDRYKIIRFINSGGFGCTYEAEHVLLHKKVAIKEFFVKEFCNREEDSTTVTVAMSSKIALTEKLKQKFIEEAKALCVFNHPNIVHVFDVFEENGTAYYVMDYIEGSSLSDIIEQNGPMNEQQALRYIKQVGSALKYVHAHNRLHLDIKPSNIMVDEDDNVVLIDFGASKQYDEVNGENTSTLVANTPGYAPLEQMSNDIVEFYPSTDIYALGATLYKLLTGSTPPNALKLAGGTALDGFPPSVSSRTCKVIIKSMRRDKTERPQDIDSFVRMLPTYEKKDAVDWRKYLLIACIFLVIGFGSVVIMQHIHNGSPSDEVGKPEVAQPTEASLVNENHGQESASVIENRPAKKEKSKAVAKQKNNSVKQTSSPSRSSISFPFGTYSGSDDGSGNGNRGTIRVTSSFSLSTNGGSISLEPGDEIRNAQVRSGHLKAGVLVHNGVRTSFFR